MIKLPEQQRDIVVLAITGLLLYVLFEFILILFISFLLIIAFLPLVRWLKIKKVPRVISSIVLVVALFAIPVLIFASLGPELVRQTQNFFDSAPQILEQLEGKTGLSTESIRQNLDQPVSQAGNYAFRFSSTALEVIIGIVAILAITIYGLIYYDQTSRLIIHFFAKNKSEVTLFQKRLKSIEKKVGSWVKGQMIISLILGMISWLAYELIGLPYAGTLALLAGALELLPTIGPTLAAIPAVLVALTISPQTALLTLAAYLIIQALEGYVITPRIMSKVIELNPFMTLLTVIAGTYLLGILGALLAIPTALLVGELYSERLQMKDP